MSSKTKNILIVILSAIVVLLIGIIAYMLIAKNNRTSYLTGKVIVAGQDYIIIESENEDYLIQNIDGDYALGDKIKITYREKNLNEDTSPKTITSERETLIEKSSPEEPNKTEPINPTTGTKTTTAKKTTTTKKAQQASADEEVIEYVDELKRDFDASSIKDSVKNGFITVVDFIFYDGTIKGHTFKDLSSSAKLKVLSAALYFDGKIEEYFPGYKESISSTTSKVYNNIKNEIVETYLNVAAKVCETNGEACETAKREFATIKKNLGLTWALIKDIAGDGIDKLKTWYEIFSGK